MLWDIPLDASRKTYSLEPKALPCSKFMVKGIPMFPESLLGACSDLLCSAWCQRAFQQTIQRLNQSMSELKIQGASLRSGHRWMSADHTWLGNRMPCPSRDRRTFWMPRRVPEETAAYSMGRCLQAPSALRHPVAGGMCLSLLLQHLLYLPCPIKAGQSMCVASISAGKPLVLAQPDLPILHRPLCGTSGDVALCYGLTLGAVCVVVAKLLGKR
jgi:hypothetical protein